MPLPRTSQQLGFVNCGLQRAWHPSPPAMLVEEIQSSHTPDSLGELLRTEPGLVVLRSDTSGGQGRYSFVSARPFLSFRSRGSRCELASSTGTQLVYGNPWNILETCLSRYELLEELDQPFPLGGCFGFWGYDLKNFVEPRLKRRAVDDLELPECQAGFYGSLVVFDHRLGKTLAVCTGLHADGSRSGQRARAELDFWRSRLLGPMHHPAREIRSHDAVSPRITSTLSKEEFESRVRRAQAYIRSGDIYQVNVSHRLAAPLDSDAWDLFTRLIAVSPAPFSAFLDGGTFQLVSSSPEMFLRLSNRHVVTRPIKGTRPRSADPTRDAQLTYELTTSSKEMAELVMITDLLRNDLGRVSEFGSVRVPELVRLERFAHVQHLVSTVEGELRDGITHFAAFASCFPGGSITGAPKIRAMEIIDELEPVARGPYTGALGYLGFNRESQLSIAIRTAVCSQGKVWFHAGAGIVADSQPEAEYEETLAKARGFIEALQSLNSTRLPAYQP